MLDPALVQAISGLGALGFAIIAVWAFATGRVVPGSLHSSALSRIDRLTDAVDKLTEALDAMDGPRDKAIDEAVAQIRKSIRNEIDGAVRRLRP